MKIAGFFTCYQIGRRTPDIAGFESILLGFGKVHLNLNLRNIEQEFHMQIGKTFNSGQLLFDLCGFGTEDIQVLADRYG